MTATVSVPEVDRVEILTVLDNSLDILMAGSETVRRVAIAGTVGEGRTTLRAEHGFSCMVTVVKGDRRESFLMDAGLTKESLLHNMDVLEIRPGDLHAIVLSHGHTDHVNGLMGFLSRNGRRRLPLVLHPDAFLRRKVVLPDGSEVLLPPPDRRGIEQEGVAILEERGTSLLLGGLGGFHLTGRLFEPLIAPTVQALKTIGPKLIVPSHCTGWKATHEIARVFPDAFVPNSVGTTFLIGAK
ncbi:MAG: MBL fold metallo-hydrolase [Candidatus Rokubacteria bacterium]|nr:MBL fold metallo-hydrolase [Candidatus Rokubacteria bacterium]